MGRLGTHSHVVSVFDLGEHEGPPYIVAELAASRVEESPKDGSAKAPARTRRPADSRHWRWCPGPLPSPRACAPNSAVVLMGVCFIAFALGPGFLPALLFLAVGNVGGMLFMATNNAVIQAKVPDEFRGRVMSVLMMSFGMMPLGVLPLTVAADVIGARAAVALSSATMLVVLAVIFTLSRRLRELNVEALGAVDLSPAEAARLVAEGIVTQEEADRRSGRLS